MPEATVDQFGAEVTESQPVKQPTIEDKSSRWSSAISKTLDVQTVLNYMTSAERGLIRYQMEMFDRMVERDPHLQAVLQTRRMALTQSEWKVTPGDEDDSKAIDAAEMVNEDLVNLPDFEDSIEALLDAVPKGLAVQEIVYADDWSLLDLVEIPQRLLDWQESDLRVYADGYKPEPMEPNKFIRHSPRIRPGTPVRRGLMRTLAIYWCISHFALEDWASYAEVFGMPLRLGKYPTNAKEGDIEILYDALKNLGSDAAGMIPEGMMIEFPEPKSKLPGVETPMETLIKHMERKMSIATLGQNLTTESQSGTGTLAGGAHERVMRSITRADARQLNTTLRRDLFRPLVGFRMGFDVPLPYIKWDLDDPTDQVMRSGVYKTLHEIGFPLSKAQVREELQLDEPIDESDLLEQQPSPGFGMFNATHSALAALNQTTAGSEPLGSAMKANARLAAAAGADGQEATQQIMDLMGKLAEDANSPEQLLTRIKLAAPDLEGLLAEAGIPMEEFEDLAARTLTTADLNGRVAVRAERKV